MENLNAEQIKKALECCFDGDCYPCPYAEIGAGCRDKNSENALALINSQEQRIKELTEENERLSKEVADLKDELKCEKETNAHLCSQYMSENHLRHQTEEMLANGMSVVKAETVREMKERLIAEFRKDDRMNYYIRMTLDQIAKEMMEGKQ